jgi:hypothetical protein
MDNGEIPLPPIAKVFTNAERVEFLESAFSVICACFERALSKLSMSYTEVETSLQKDTGLREFTCFARTKGQTLSRCRIKIERGKFRSPQISYCSFHSNGDEWISDWLSVGTKGRKLMLDASTLWMGGAHGRLTPEQGAARFWDQFTHRLVSASDSSIRSEDSSNRNEGRTNGST